MKEVNKFFLSIFCFYFVFSQAESKVLSLGRMMQK